MLPNPFLPPYELGRQVLDRLAQAVRAHGLGEAPKGSARTALWQYAVRYSPSSERMADRLRPKMAPQQPV